MSTKIRNSTKMKCRSSLQTLCSAMARAEHKVAPVVAVQAAVDLQVLAVDLAEVAVDQVAVVQVLVDQDAVVLLVKARDLNVLDDQSKRLAQRMKTIG